MPEDLTSKSSHTGLEESGYGHRGGIGREADVYRHVLEPLEETAPKFYST